MTPDFKNAIEEAVPGLKIDGVVSTSDAVAVAAKVIEVTTVVAASIVPDGKVNAADVTSVVKAAAVLAPESFKKAVLDELEREVKASRTKIDDAIALPLIAIFRRVFGVK